MNNLFVKQFDQNIKFNYSCFDRVVLRGYIIRLFFAGGYRSFASRPWLQFFVKRRYAHIDRSVNTTPTYYSYLSSRPVSMEKK